MFRTLIVISLSTTAIARAPRQGYSCIQNQLQCRNGSCVPFGSHCDDGLNYTNGSSQPDKHRQIREIKPITKLCVLPQYPKDGTYRVANVPDAYPTQSFESLMLTVSCRRGYGVVDADDSTNAIGGHVYCINGVWLQKMPKCVRFCKVSPDPSVRYMCHVQGTGFKACGKYVAPGTTVKPICNSLYHSNEDLPYMTCIAGFWDSVPHCKADCGLITPEGEQLVIGGELAKRGELPWHVGIYDKTGNSYEQICGGSLITSNVVISAAHCFWDDRIKLRPASDYAVGIGKLYREWNSDMDVGTQESDVKEIKVPTLFKGETTNFQEDIAVVILVSSFVYKPYVRPVCLNFDTNFDTYQLQHDKFGKVAGWGLTSANGGGSPILKVVSLPYVKTDTCIDTLPPSFTEYITSDKFCAGYTNGTALCKGDSGGGLAFAERGEQGRYRYYLRGVVSTAPRHENNLCNNATLTTFTKIKKHEEFIKRSLAASANKTCPWYLFQCNDGACVDQGADCNGIQDCADGSDEAAELCTPDTEALDKLSDRACVFPTMPKGARYRIMNTSKTPEPGRILKSFGVVIECHRYKYLLSSDLRIKSYYSYTVICVDGKWSNEMPTCIDYCDVDTDRSLFYRCRHPVHNSPTVCHKYKKPGLACSPVTYTDHVRADPEIKCPSNSSKDGVVNCKKDCGKVTYLKEDKGQVGGKPVKHEYMPWHVSVYEKSGKDYLYHCGGTLISNNVVLSAADRFWDEEKGYIRYSEWGAAAGQMYRLWEDEKNIHAQTTDVKGITLPDSYAGRSRGFLSDIAVLILVDPFVFNTYVRHVCLDWNAELEEKHLEEGNTGQIAGWGRSSKDSPLRQQVLQLHNTDSYYCDLHVPWLQDDQICSTYPDDNLQFLNSNLGSGLVFAHNDSGVERFYLRGILTRKCLKDDVCYFTEGHHFATFTKIGYLKKFIQHNTLLK